jgi:hypothetical protein
MLSITQLKKNIYPLFYIMRRTGSILEIVYKGAVYDVHVQKTKKTPCLTRAKRSRLEGATVQHLDVITCRECGSVMVAGICMNKGCQVAPQVAS